MMLFVLMLRHSITKFRDLGGSRFLPLDNVVYIHKVIGYVCLTFAVTHSVMHVLNFSEYNNRVQPEKFVI